MIFSQFKVNTPEYQQSLVLRENILRAPLGLTLSEQDLARENEQLHFGLFKQAQIQAVVLLKPISATTLKLRQMAVSSEQQGQGLGKTLIQNAEQEVSKLDYKRIEMAARLTAVPFYQSLGYETIGAPFNEVGIEHIKMAKQL